jgi:hypothetical protein
VPDFKRFAVICGRHVRFAFTITYAEPVRGAQQSGLGKKDETMATLAFTHNGWRVITSSWSAASNKSDRTRIVYVWGPDVISWFDSATGTASFELYMSIGEFERLVATQSFVDLDKYFGRAAA